MKLALISFIIFILVFISWSLLIIDDSFDKPNWFKKFFDTNLGVAILFVAGLLVILSLIFSYGPDSFWN